MCEIHIARIAAQDVPGGGEHSVQNDIGGKVDIAVLHHTREQQAHAKHAEGYCSTSHIHSPLPPEEAGGSHGQG